MVTTGTAFVLTALGRLMGHEPFSRFWRQPRRMLARAGLLWILALLGLVLEASFLNLLGFSPLTLSDVLAGGLGLSLLLLIAPLDDIRAKSRTPVSAACPGRRPRLRNWR
ncbi:MAG: hypothetical protein NZM16_10840 [Thermoflexus sp.]|nr:hypothetical protein [Thermoflexus sp.]MDW8185718.1 hypothetical protein [Anaerolineae bacterium]